MKLPFDIQPPSFQSVFIEAEIDSNDGTQTKSLGTATGFFCCRGESVCLMTARHVVTGRDHNTNVPLDSNAHLPTHLRVWFRVGTFDRLQDVRFPLRDPGGRPRWLEHPELRGKADVAALAVPAPSNVLLWTYPGRIEQPIRIAPMELVSVIGFPLGKSTNTLAVWTTGYIASEPTLDHDGEPVVLVSCRTTKGQSGSPVLAVRSGHVMLEGDRAMVGFPTCERFVGLYAGRLAESLDIGRVWKAEVVLATAMNGVTPEPSEHEDDDA